MPLRISRQAASVFGALTVCAGANKVHNHYLRRQAIATLKANNLALHVFYSRDLTYPIAGHYYEQGHRHRSKAPGNLVWVCKFKEMYETPSAPSAKISVANTPVTWHETATWPNILNQVEVLVADEQTKPIAVYLEKVMKREAYEECGSHAIELSELARR